MGSSVSTDETRTPDRETSPGWRELLENLYAQIEDARARELFLQRLLCEERQALQRLRRAGPPRPAVAQLPSEPSTMHRQIFAVLQQHPDGCTRAEIEAAVEATQPLGGVLDGLARRKHITRLGKGVFALRDAASRTAEGGQRR